jgi:hypothetical protein
MHDIDDFGISDITDVFTHIIVNAAFGKLRRVLSEIDRNLFQPAFWHLRIRIVVVIVVVIVIVVAPGRKEPL